MYTAGMEESEQNEQRKNVHSRNGERCTEGKGKSTQHEWRKVNCMNGERYTE